MDSERWQRLSRLFEEICDLPRESRESRLAEIAREEPGVAQELRSMLDADGARDGVLATGAGPYSAAPAGEASSALGPGSRLGPYEIESPLGAGGMGEVYRARDTRLDRAVAIKVITVARAASGDTRRRFEQEARAVSRLQHPHICALFDIGSHEGTDYLVMELLEGESLAARLHRGAMPLDQVLRYGREVALALDYAHRHGIVHRDLKPANVMVTRAGAKLLDFGIARIGSRGNIATTRTALTAEGTILGTVQYMAPEQLEGRESDARTDLFALGALLFEMATGRPAFDGESQATLIAAILTTEPPPVSTLLKLSPSALDRLVRTCLAKDPEERWQSAQDVATQLAGISEAGSQAITAVSQAEKRRGRFRRWLLPAAAGALLAAGLVWTLAARGGIGPGAPAPFLHQQTFRHGTVTSARFAPDGQTIVYSAAWDGQPFELFTTRRGSAEARPLGVGPARLLAISADSELAILRGGGGRRSVGSLALVPLAGGTPRDVLEDVREADWISSGKELAAVRRTKAGDVAEVPLGHAIHQAPYIWSLRASHRGDSIAFFAGVGPYQGDLYVSDRSGKVRALSTDWIVGQGIAWSPSDDEIWFSGTRGERETAVRAVSLSGRERLLLQAPDPLYVMDLFPDGAAIVGRNDERQNLACLVPGANEERELGWFGSSWLADLSADGKTVLFSEGEAGGGKQGSVYIRPTDGSAAIRLGDGLAEGLSPDGSRVLARSRDGRELAILPTGAGTRRALPLGSVESVDEADWLDDRQIVFEGVEKGHGSRIYIQDVDNGEIRSLTPEGAEIAPNAPTPDGRSILVYLSDKPMLLPVASGEPQPLTFLEPRDLALQWSPDGQHLLVRHGGPRAPVEIQQLDVVTGERQTLRKIQPRVLGADRLAPLMLTPSGDGYCYTYNLELGDLFLVVGLR